MFYFVGFLLILMAERIKRSCAIPVPFFRRELGLDSLYFIQEWLFKYLYAFVWLIPFLVPYLRPHRETPLHPIAAVLIVMVTHDFIVYYIHRALHSFKFSWEVHRAHHSVRHLDGISSFRRHFLEHPAYGAVYLILVFVFGIFLGFPKYCAPTAVAINALIQIFNHSNIKIDPNGLLSRIIGITFFMPQTHRLHHMTPYQNKNFGNVLSLWDRMHGTYQSLEAATAVDIGFRKSDAYPSTFWGQQLRPFKKLISSHTK